VGRAQLVRCMKELQRQVKPLMDCMGALGNQLQAGPAKNHTLEQQRDAQMLAIVGEVAKRLQSLSGYLDNPVALHVENELLRSTIPSPRKTTRDDVPRLAWMPAAKGPEPPESVHPSNRVSVSPTRAEMQSEAGSLPGDFVLPVPTFKFTATGSAAAGENSSSDSHPPHPVQEVAAKDSVPQLPNGSPAASAANAWSYAQSVHSKLGSASPSVAAEVKGLRLEFGSGTNHSPRVRDAIGASASVGKVYGRARRRQPSLATSSLAGFLDRPQLEEAAWNPVGTDPTSRDSTTAPPRVADIGKIVVAERRNGPSTMLNTLDFPGKSRLDFPGKSSVLSKPPRWGPDSRRNSFDEELPPYLREETIMEPDDDR